MTGCIAILVGWAVVTTAVPWGMVEGYSCTECQILADAMAKEQNTVTEQCIPYGPDYSMKDNHVRLLKTYTVKWVDAL